MLGMSCVPGAFFAAPGGGGLVPVRGVGSLGPVFDELGALGGIRSPAAFWNAPRCESALLTASGETGGTGAVPSSAPGAPGGAPDGGFDVVAGGGPYGEPIAREAGDAVAANGFTGGDPAGIGGP